MAENNRVKPKILIIDNSIAVTGALKAILNMAVSLQSSFDFSFILPKHSLGKTKVEKDLVFKVFEFKMVELGKNYLSLMMYLPFLVHNSLRLKKLVKKSNIDLIHVNDLYNLLPPLAQLFGAKTPYICHIRFMPQRFPAWLFNFWLGIHLKYAKKIIVVSNTLRQQLPDNDKIVVLYDGFKFEDSKLQLAPSKTSTFIFLYLGNIIQGKGQNFALAAFAKIHSQLPGWKLRFVGGDMGLKKNREYRERLQKDAKAQGIDEKIEWEEFTPDVETEYSKAEIVLNFSESESFSMTSLEALACSRPLIVTDCGGPTEIVTNEVTGLVVPNRNVESMAESMSILASSKILRDTLAKKGRESVKEKFNLTKTSRRMEMTYESCLQEG